MVNAHYAKLINLPVATFKSASLRSFCNTTEKHLRCLRSLGQDDNQLQVLSMMQLKFPRSLLLKLEEMKPEGEERTVENVRMLLKRHINAQEAGDLQVMLFQKPDDSSRPPISNKLTHTIQTWSIPQEKAYYLTNTKNLDLEKIASFAMMSNIGVMNAVDTLTSNSAENN